jgi:ATP-dependent helicase YprA (DUF1998 family)
MRRADRPNPHNRNQFSLHPTVRRRARAQIAARIRREQAKVAAAPGVCICGLRLSAADVRGRCGECIDEVFNFRRRSRK